MIHEHGLADYYRVRSESRSSPLPAQASSREYHSYDAASFLEQHSILLASGARQADLRLEGIHCAACLWLVERLPQFVRGVSSARLSLRESVVRLIWDPNQVTQGEIARTLDRLGYPSHPASKMSASDVRHRDERRQMVRMGVAGACAGNAMLVAVALYAGEFQGMETEYANLFRVLSAVIAVVSLSWPGSVFFRGAWVALRTRTANLDLPIALALGAGGIAGLWNVVRGAGAIYFDSLCVLVFLLLVGRWFQSRQQRRAVEAVDLLQKITPAVCRVVRGQSVHESPIELLVEGDEVEVLSGGVIPADGEVRDGRSTLNRSLLTGESHAVAVEPGDCVFAGTQNIGSTIRLVVATTGEDTRAGRLMRLVESGVRAKPPLVEWTDRAAGWFVLAVVGIAIATFIGWAAMANMELAVTHTIALLIVACPCALGLATPLTLAAAVGLAAQRNILIKNAAVFEKMAAGGRILLDKTGTLTQGRPAVTNWEGPRWLMPVVAQIESHSSHPVANALVEAGSQQPYPENLPSPRAIEERGDGGMRAELEGRRVLIGSPAFLQSNGLTFSPEVADSIAQQEVAGQTVIGVAVGDELEVVVWLGDRLRDDSAQAVAMLQQRNWQPSILSGDAEGVVQFVAKQVGIAAGDAFAQVSPEEKLAHATSKPRQVSGEAASAGETLFRRQGHHWTAMVGDGVNDAAALAAADIGIAVDGGAEAALMAADVYLASPGLGPLVELVDLSQRTIRVVRQNLVIAASYNALAVSLAAIGWVTPLLAAVLMPLSSATVLASAMRVTYWREK